MKKLIQLIFITALIPSFLLANPSEEFGKAMNEFHIAPTLEKFVAFQELADRLEDELCTKENNVELLASVMVAKISQKHSWPITGEGKIATAAREIAKGQSDLAKYVTDDAQVDPSKLDIWWCSYFATGDTQYLDRLLTYAGEELPSDDINQMMIIGAASWSFKSNCQQHESIKDYVSTQVDAPKYAHKKAFIRECAGLPVDEGFSWRDDKGNPIPNTENQKTKDGFGAQLLITDNLEFYTDWQKPEMPHISVPKSAKIGQLVVPILIYVNPKLDENKKIDVSCDLTILRPDGSIDQELPNIPCGSGVFEAPQYNLQLSRSELRWCADEGDPIGEWTIKVNIKDNNKGVEIQLRSSIEITE